MIHTGLVIALAFIISGIIMYMILSRMIDDPKYIISPRQIKKDLQRPSGDQILRLRKQLDVIKKFRFYNESDLSKAITTQIENMYRTLENRIIELRLQDDGIVTVESQAQAALETANILLGQSHAPASDNKPVS